MLAFNQIIPAIWSKFALFRKSTFDNYCAPISAYTWKLSAQDYATESHEQIHTKINSLQLILTEKTRCFWTYMAQTQACLLIIEGMFYGRYATTKCPSGFDIRPKALSRHYKFPCIDFNKTDQTRILSTNVRFSRVQIIGGSRRELRRDRA